MWVLERVEQLAIDARADQLRHASQWLERSAQQRAVPPQQISRLDLCLNECLANVIAHGGDAARTAPVQLALEYQQGAGTSQATLSVSDAGACFNPFSAAAVPRPKSLEQAQPGGLGLSMMRDSCDAMAYRYEAGRNQLSFTVRWPAALSPEITP